MHSLQNVEISFANDVQSPQKVSDLKRLWHICKADLWFSTWADHSFEAHTSWYADRLVYKKFWRWFGNHISKNSHWFYFLFCSMPSTSSAHKWSHYMLPDTMIISVLGEVGVHTMGKINQWFHTVEPTVFVNMCIGDCMTIFRHKRCTSVYNF